MWLKLVNWKATFEFSNTYARNHSIVNIEMEYSMKYTEKRKQKVLSNRYTNVPMSCSLNILVTLKLIRKLELTWKWARAYRRNNLIHHGVLYVTNPQWKSWMVEVVKQNWGINQMQMQTSLTQPLLFLLKKSNLFGLVVMHLWQKGKKGRHEAWPLELPKWHVKLFQNRRCRCIHF